MVDMVTEGGARNANTSNSYKASSYHGVAFGIFLGFALRCFVILVVALSAFFN